MFGDVAGHRRNPHIVEGQLIMRTDDKTRFAIRILCTLCGFAAFASTSQAEVKRSIAVAPVQSTAGAVSWVSGEAIQAQMITELNNSGRYRVVERENIGGILAEQDMGAAGRTRKGSGPKTGDLEGAQMMIKGVITDAEEESGKGGNGSFGGLSLGGKKTVYRVTMDFRIYDMQTSLIMDTISVTAEQVKKKKGGGVRIGKFGAGGDKSEGDTTGAIVRDLIKQALAGLDKQAEVMGWKSHVLKFKNDKAIILGGKRDGLETGMRFTMFELGEKVIDEDTGEVLDEGEETEVGVIELTQIKDKVAYATLMSGKTPANGFVVKLNK
jgi:curli biogenesis system outer membrane secretion channel CsgG